MLLPFSRDAFLNVFAAYNTALWPMAMALWIATVVALIVRVAGRGRDEWTFGLLAVQWAWTAIAYHGAFFSRINPAAWIFAILFLMQAGLLTWYGVAHSRLGFSIGNVLAEVAGYGLIVYGLLYPLIALAGGLSYPRVPTFGVPCPTAIVTIGFLMLAGRTIPAILTIVPMVWGFIGGSAVAMLGMRVDVGLIVAATALAVQMISMKQRAIA